jgi:hypothetical protein
MGFLDDIVSGITGVPTQVPQPICRGIGDSAITKLTAQNAQTAAAWRVEKLYYAADLRRIYESVMNSATGIMQQAETFKKSGVDADFGGLTNAMTALYLHGVDDGKKFVTAYQEATAKGIKVIEAPDFKAWALKLLDLAVQVQWWITYTFCRQQTGGVTFLTRALKLVYDIVVAVAEAVVEIGMALVSVPGKVAELFGVLKWVALVGGLGFVAFKGKRLYDARKALSKGGA